MKDSYVYILSNRYRTIYIGVTNNLDVRLWQHRHEGGSLFAKKYRLTQLVYFEYFSDMSSAIAREKQLKHWRREKKVALIEQMNPKWLDLSPEPLDRCCPLPPDPSTSSG